MEFKQMTIPKLKEYLDELGIDHSKAKLREEFVALAEEASKQEEVQEPAEETEIESTEVDETTDESEDEDLTSIVQASLSKPKEKVVVKQTLAERLKGRDYSSLTVGQRQAIREESPEYQSVSQGIEVQVTDRLATKGRVVKLADKAYSKLFKGEKYTISNEDYEVLKDEVVKVKTVATQNKCCGSAKWEQIKLLEVING